MSGNKLVFMKVEDIDYIFYFVRSSCVRLFSLSNKLALDMSDMFFLKLTNFIYLHSCFPWLFVLKGRIVALIASMQ